MWRAGLPAWALIAASLLIASCGGGSDTPDFPEVVQLGGDADVSAHIVNSTLAVGDNRVSIGLTDLDGEPVLGAGMKLRFYDLNGGDPELRAQADARFVPLQLGYIDEQAPSPEPTSSGDGGVYVSNVTFDRAGEWGVEVRATVDGEELDPLPFRFNVLDDTPEPSVGEPAPPSMQMILANVATIEDIDSSFPPRPAMHEMTIADAVASGRPSVIAFATPAYCRSRTCAPVMDTVVDPLATKYASRVNFIHVEPYVLSELRAANVQNAVSAVREWQLLSEPWIFVVDSEGRIAAKFEGIVALDEVESVLALTLGEAAEGVTPIPSDAAR